MLPKSEAEMDDLQHFKCPTSHLAVGIRRLKT